MKNQEEENTAKKAQGIDGNDLPPAVAAVNDDHSRSATVKRQKNYKRQWLFVVVGIAVVLVIASIVYAIVYKAAVKSDDLTTATAAVNSIKAKLVGTPLQTQAVAGMGGKTVEGYAGYTLPVYEVAGKQYETSPSNGKGFGVITTPRISSDNYKDLQTYLTKNHFSVVNTQAGKGIAAFLSQGHNVNVAAYTVYDSTDVRCVTWRLDITNIQADSNVTSVGCADKSDYQKMADVVQPYFEAYGINDKISNEVYGAPVVADGSDGYKNAVLYQEVVYKDSSAGTDTIKVYYYKPVNGDWTYFHLNRGSEIVNCSTFTDVYKKAFAGSTCYDTVKQIQSKV